METKERLSNSRAQKTLNDIKGYYNPDAPLTMEEWLNDYSPLNLEILFYKFSGMIKANIKRQIQNYSEFYKYQLDEEELFSEIYTYIAERLGYYNPSLGAQSNWITWQIKGAITDYTRRIVRKKHLDITFSDIAENAESKNEDKDEEDVLNLINDGQKAGFYPSEEEKNISKTRVAEIYQTIARIAHEYGILKKNEKNESILCLSPQKKKKLREKVLLATQNDNSEIGKYLKNYLCDMV